MKYLMKLLLSLAILPTLMTAMQAPLVPHIYSGLARTTQEVILPSLIKLISIAGTDCISSGYLDRIPETHLDYCLDQIVQLIAFKSQINPYCRVHDLQNLFSEDKFYSILSILRGRIIDYKAAKARKNAPDLHHSVRSYEHNALAKINEDHELAQALELSRLEHEKEQKIRSHYAEQKAAELKAYEAQQKIAKEQQAQFQCQFSNHSDQVIFAYTPGNSGRYSPVPLNPMEDSEVIKPSLDYGDIMIHTQQGHFSLGTEGNSLVLKKVARENKQEFDLINTVEFNNYKNVIVIIKPDGTVTFVARNI